MSRPVNKERPAELRSAIVRYLIQHGLVGLSLRPLAKALGCTPRVLLYHFGSKEKMIGKVLAQARQQQRVTYDRLETASLAESYQKIWKRMSAPESEPIFRLFFETYGVALRHPQLYKAFLRDTIGDWLRPMADGLCRQGYKRKYALALATIVLAGFRGFMLDFCTTHDRRRLNRAVRLWINCLDSMLSARKGVLKP